MPKYLFTSDQRISILPERIKSVSEFILEGHTISEIADKSENNNSSTLKFYYNLHAGTETCLKSAENPFFAIRNFVLKFQFPNVRTSESLSDSLNEKTLFAPFRSVVKVLYRMAGKSDDLTGYISMDEILYYLFCDPYVYENPLVDYDAVIENIYRGRKCGIDLRNKIDSIIEWNQYGRQSKELFTVLTYASQCFKLSKGIISFSLNSKSYATDKEYIDQILEYSKFWYPSNPSDFNHSTLEYISYMDTSNTPYTVIDFKKETRVKKMLQMNLPLQQIFYGAPGTGKSHTINEQTKGESVIRTTFHPDSDYSTFVGAYKPTTKSVELRDVSGHKIIEEGKEVKEDRIVYEFVAQAFLQAYILAWKSYSQPTDEGVVKPQYLVIEEINRGNCAQIFGDIFQLLDRDDNGFSKYEITSDADLQKYIAEQNLAVSGVCDSHGKDISDKINSGELLKLPNNFYIWATMNTSDQSLFPIDSAFKRRWDWKYVPIDTNKENWTIKTATKEYSWSLFLQKINDEIDDTTHSEDKMLGFYFCKADDGVISSEKFVGKVLFYVYNDVFKDYGFSREMFKGDDGKIISFHSYYNSDGSIDENKVEKFLDNLIQNENSTIPSEENIEQ